MSHKYDVEYTDTFAGVANYCWVKRSRVAMPELTHYGYDGSTNYVKANKIYQRELTKRIKAELGLTGHPCAVYHHGDMVEIRPRGLCTVAFATWAD